MFSLEAKAIRLIKLKMLASDQFKPDPLKLISEVFRYNFLRAFVDQAEVAGPPKYPLEALVKEQLREPEIENATILKVQGK